MDSQFTVFNIRFFPGLFLLATILVLNTHAARAEEQPLRIPHVTRAPKLSDFLTNTPREAEAVVTVFRQFDPHDGDLISQPTTAFLSYDNKNIYVGWICKDDPAKIRAHQLAEHFDGPAGFR